MQYCTCDTFNILYNLIIKPIGFLVFFPIYSIPLQHLFYILYNIMVARFTSLVAAIGLIATSVNASGMIAQVVDATNFCVFLPPSDSTDRIISNTEWNANAFCMGSTPGATGAEKLPSGFITSAHYVKTDAYVQVTGQMDYTKANLVGTDEGGQMDVRAPMGSSCAGWDYYVNLIEPVSNTYCMRCCVSCNSPSSSLIKYTNIQSRMIL